MEKARNNTKTENKLIPAIGFIKTRKLEEEAMEMAVKLHEGAKDQGFLILGTCVDRDGSRDIDREALDEIYDLMKFELFHDLFIRSMEDISARVQDQIAFLRYADDHDVTIHVLDVDEEEEVDEVWDGGAGC